MFDPGQVLYEYESAPGYTVMVSLVLVSDLNFGRLRGWIKLSEHWPGRDQKSILFSAANFLQFRCGFGLQAAHLTH